MGKPLVSKRKRGHVARREKARKPQMVEGPKRTLLIRGTRAGEHGLKLLRDVKKMQGGERGLLFSRKNDEVRPFENETSIEFFCNKNDCALFTLVSHNKKRPNNAIFGRIFDNQLLDMVEVGIDSYESIEDTIKRTHNPVKALGGQTAVIFQGAGWDSNEQMRTLQSLFLDLFKQHPHSKVDMSAIDHLCTCTAADGKVFVRNYSVVFKGKEAASAKKDPKVGVLSVEGTKIPEIALMDMGPSMDLSLRRNKLPSPELMKMALKKAKLATTAKKRKNVSHDDLQGKVGRIHMKKQDMSELVTRSRFGKVLKRGKGAKDKPAAKTGA